MENAIALNTLDTLTNLIFLMVALLPLYIPIFGFVVAQAPIKRHALVKVTNNNHLKIITLRNPYSGQWLFTLTVGNKAQHITLKPTVQPHTLPVTYANPYRFAMGCIALFALCACFTSPEGTHTDKVSTRYVDASYDGKKSCWFPIQPNPQRDSLFVEGRKYVVSDRSRYRAALLSEGVIDGLYERDVIVNDWGFYKDTKGDSVIVLNRCDYNAIDLGGE